jgi:hypothetical protein
MMMPSIVLGDFLFDAFALWEPMGRPRIEVRGDSVAKAAAGGYHRPNGAENRKK